MKENDRVIIKDASKKSLKIFSQHSHASKRLECPCHLKGKIVTVFSIDGDVAILSTDDNRITVAHIQDLEELQDGKEK